MLKFLNQFWKCDRAVAAVEAGLMFPLMASILLGVVDLGTAITVNQKVMNSSHMFADLLAREDDINDAEFNDYFVAAQLVIQPYSLNSMGYDVVGIQFLGSSETPTEIWRDTFNMSENPGVVSDADGLGIEDEGVLAVTVGYRFEPFFSNFVVGNIDMEEVSFARGRSGLFITRSN